MLTIHNWEEYTYFLLLHLKNGEKEQFRTEFLALDANSQVDFYYMLNKQQQKQFFQTIYPDEFSVIFTKLNEDEQSSVMEIMKYNYLLKVMQHLPKEMVTSYYPRFVNCKKILDE